MFKYPVYKPYLKGNEKKYVNQCIDSTWISSKGEFIKNFEEGFTSFIGTKHCVSVSNGTVALHTALLALGIKPGDEVIVPTLTYIASVNAIKYTGATPVFVDSESEYWQLDPGKLQEAITPNTKAIMVVHLYGHPCDMDKITEIAKKHNLYIIEDCAEALGAKYKGINTGMFGNIATYSFFGNKTLTTGEGGMVVTNDTELYDKAKKYKGQGLVEGREYWHDLVGYNYRMTNIQAAIGLAQLEQIDEILAKKAYIAELYKRHLSGLPVEFHAESSNAKHSYWMCSILLNESSYRTPLRKYLQENSIETRPLFFPIHEMPIYKTEKQYLQASNIAYRGINLPSYPDLAEEDIEFISGKIRSFYEEN